MPTVWPETKAPAVYEWTGPTGVHFRQIKEPSGVYYHEGAPRAVIDGLEQAMRLDLHVRLWLGDSETGRDWLEEWDVAGRVGCSMGPIKIPLLLRTRHSTGGGGIGDRNIVRLFVAGCERYRHPLYVEPVCEIREENVYPDSPWCVDVNGDTGHARFKSEKAAQRWVDFMLGRRMSK